MAPPVKFPCQTIVLRYMPDAVSGEALNVGVVLACPGLGFLQAKSLTQLGRVTAAFPSTEVMVVRRATAAIDAACDGWGQRRKEPGFHLLPAPEGTFIQPAGIESKGFRSLADFLRSVVAPEEMGLILSEPLPGVTGDPEATLNDLFERLVGRNVQVKQRQARDDSDVWRSFERDRLDPAVSRLLGPHRVAVKHYAIEFQHAWKNGHWNAIQPLSLDLVEPSTIREKAAEWSGKLLTLHLNPKDTEVALIVGLPANARGKAIRKAADDALAILHENLDDAVEVVTEDQARPLAEKIANDLGEAASTKH